MMSKSKWFVANNKAQKNKDIINVIPNFKIWYSKNYLLKSGSNFSTPAFGFAISWLKWNYYLTIQKNK